MLFHDLSVEDGKEGEEVYASPQVVAIHQKLEKYVTDLGYKPPRLIYEPVTLESSLSNGIYTDFMSQFKPNTAESLKEMIMQVIEMEILF